MAVRSFTCPQSDGFLDLSKTDFACTLAGDHLASVASVRLVSARDSGEKPLEVKLRPAVTAVKFGACGQAAGTCTLKLAGANLARVAQLSANCSGTAYPGLPDPAAAASDYQFYFRYDQVNGKSGCRISIHFEISDLDAGKSVDFK